jgi:hypothetical protein
METNMSGRIEYSRLVPFEEYLKQKEENEADETEEIETERLLDLGVVSLPECASLGENSWWVIVRRDGAHRFEIDEEHGTLGYAVEALVRILISSSNPEDYSLMEKYPMREHLESVRYSINWEYLRLLRGEDPEE